MTQRQTALGDLIAETRREMRLSLRQVAARSGTPGIGHNRVRDLEKGNFVSPPKRETLQALARGLGLPYSVVKEAATESLGGPTRLDVGDEVTILVAEAAENLSAKQRKEWVRMARALLRQYTED